MTMRVLAVAVALSAFLNGQSIAPVNSRSDAGIRGLFSPTAGVIWASGTAGTVLRSVDDGRSWQRCAMPPAAEALDFRGVFAWNSQKAIVMSSGTGPASRLYRTTDGCRTWQSVFTNPDVDGFWDSLVFDRTHPETGVLLGDPVGGRFTIFRTTDSGDHWERDSSGELASDKRGEGAFAASNSSIAIVPSTGDLVFGTGGLGGFRIFHYWSDRKKWTRVMLPSATHSESAGIFSMTFRDSKRGVAVGGDYKAPASRDATAFYTFDGGLTWAAASGPPAGYRSAVNWNAQAGRWFAAGTTGVDVSSDGKTWGQIDRGSWNTLLSRG